MVARNIMVASSLPLVVALIVALAELPICQGFISPIIAHSIQPQSAIWVDDVTRVPNNVPHCHHHHYSSTTKTTTASSSSSLAMGLFDFIQENFLDDREGDFIPLEKSDDDTFGPGPLILMYAVPESMDDDELRDMVDDGMPDRRSGVIVVRRLSGMDQNGEGGDELLDSTVEEALNEAINNDVKSSSSSSGTTSTSLTTSAIKPIVVNSSRSEQEQTPCPLLYFSGVSNTEMMDTYRIIANEIYEETSRVHWPACAKVVPPAMGKSMRQVISEISGDHADAMKLRREEAERGGTVGES